MVVRIDDVARRAGVSPGTVSNVLNHPHKVTPSVTERVQEAIEALGYLRNDAARQLRAGSSRMIGLVVMDWRNPFFTEVARGAEERAAAAGMSILLANSDSQRDRERVHLDAFAQQRVAGVIIAPVADELPALRRLRDRGIPSVLLDRGASDPTFPSITVDDVHGGYLAVRHLLDIGRRRVAFAGGPMELRQIGYRLEGGQRAAAETPGATLEYLGAEALTVEQGRLIGLQLLAREPHHRPDAVFAANDLLAIGILQTLVLDRDVRVPHDIAVIGYDDIDFSAAAVIPLSSVRQPAADEGATAVDLLLRSPDGGGAEHIVFEPELVVRATTVAG